MQNNYQFFNNFYVISKVLYNYPVSLVRCGMEDFVVDKSMFICYSLCIYVSPLPFPVQILSSVSYLSCISLHLPSFLTIPFLLQFPSQNMLWLLSSILREFVTIHQDMRVEITICCCMVENILLKYKSWIEHTIP
jgi:hypothetical protein